MSEGDEGWLGRLTISQSDIGGSGVVHDPMELSKNNDSSTAVQEVTDYYQQNLDKVTLPKEAEISKEEIIKIMRAIAQALIIEIDLLDPSE